jgi:hypothetical protein
MIDFGPVPPIIDEYFGRGPGFARWEDLLPADLARFAFHGQVEPADRLTALRVADAQYNAAVQETDGPDLSWPYLVARTEISEALRHAGIAIISPEQQL